MNNYTDYLQHHGIKGQKWGVRRFQNKDGSLTAAGRRRYNVSVDNGATYGKKERSFVNDAVRLMSDKRYDSDVRWSVSAISRLADKYGSTSTSIGGRRVDDYDESSDYNKITISTGKQIISTILHDDGNVDVKVSTDRGDLVNDRFKGDSETTRNFQKHTQDFKFKPSKKYRDESEFFDDYYNQFEKHMGVDGFDYGDVDDDVLQEFEEGMLDTMFRYANF